MEDGTVRVKGVALRDFLSEQPEWRARLRDEELKRLNANSRAALLAELLPQLAEYARNRREIWTRLEDLRDLARRSSEAKWRLEVRRGSGSTCGDTDMTYRRGEMRLQIVELGAQRRQYVAEQIETKGLDGSQSFDSVVRLAVRKKAEEKGFYFPES